MDNKTIAGEDARHAAQLESMKARVEGDINAGIARRAELGSTPESQRMEKVAEGLRGEAISGVVGVKQDQARERGLARTAQVINYLFGILYTLLLVRLLLSLAAARSSAGFVRLINALTNPFYSMFRGIVASPTAEGGHALVVPLLFAIAAYGLLHVGILGVLRLIAHRETEL